jgi:hypothetical protein
MFAISPLDIFGLYLNNFAWTYEGTITTWAIGIPILVGLACARRETLRRQAPLLACGAAALTLGMTPKIGFIGRAMASVQPLFPSRFPAADYKAAVAIALIVLSADAWSTIATRPARGKRQAAVALLCGALIAGALLAPSTHAQPTRELWLVIAVSVVCGLIASIRLPRSALVVLLLALVVVDGMREIGDYQLGGVVSPWKEPPTALAFYFQRNDAVRQLPERLAQTVRSRPARVPAAATAEPNASGWVADAYHEADYDPTIERTLWEAQQDPRWLALLLAPWHAYTFPCARVGCDSGAVHLPPPQTWRPSPAVQSLSYGLGSITYSVHVPQPVLMVENELAVHGWQADASTVRVVNAGIPLRAWRLSPGTYSFTAKFVEPDRIPQELAAVLALVAWLGCLLALRRKPTKHETLTA